MRASVSLDKQLLALAQQFALAHHRTVSDLIADGLRTLVGAEGAPAGTRAPSDPACGPWAQLLAWMEEQQATLTEIRNQLGDVAASLPNDAPPDTGKPAPGTRIPPP